MSTITAQAPRLSGRRNPRAAPMPRWPSASYASAFPPSSPSGLGCPVPYRGSTGLPSPRWCWRCPPRRGRGGSSGLGGPTLALALLAGCFFAGDLSLWNTSLLYTSAANSTLLGNTSTLWVSLWALLVLHEVLHRRFWVGTALALVGATLIVGPDMRGGATEGWGDFLALGSSLFYAAYLLTTGRVRRTAGTVEFMWLSSFGAALVLLVFNVATGLPLWGFTFDQYAALVALGLISHVAGWLCINYALGHVRASLTSVSLLAQPVITAIASVPLLGEALSVAQIVGGGLVLAGIYLANRRPAAPATAEPTGAGEPAT